ncbi:MAG: putative transcriptional regulator [Spirosomataceae bacterium]|jgi:putative transcriptional regulator
MAFEVTNDQEPAAGKLLISEPFINDNNFDRTVILLCEHNENGSFGLVLNQEMPLKLSDIIESNYSEQPIFTGGPVEQNTLHFLHRLGSEVAQTVEVTENVYWGGNFDYVKTMLNFQNQPHSDVRLFVGYSGWEPGQLQNEINRNSWYISNADAALVFDTPAKSVWRETLRRMGGNYRVISNYPTDPRLN